MKTYLRIGGDDLLLRWDGGVGLVGEVAQGSGEVEVAHDAAALDHDSGL